MHFELSRGSTDKNRHVLCLKDRFYTDVPQHVLARGPWQMLSTGLVAELKPEYRLALGRDKYVYIEQYPVGFSVTVK